MKKCSERLLRMPKQRCHNNKEKRRNKGNREEASRGKMLETIAEKLEGGIDRGQIRIAGQGGTNPSFAILDLMSCQSLHSMTAPTMQRGRP